MGENKWRYEDAWPLDRAKSDPLLLHSAGKAKTTAGDGSLSSLAAQIRNGRRPSSTIPLTPFPPRGPAMLRCQASARRPSGSEEVEARPDVLVYSTPPLEQDTEVPVPSRWSSTPAPAVDTDFTAKLVDVWPPTAIAQNLTEGILRARYPRLHHGAAKLLYPAQIYPNQNRSVVHEQRLLQRPPHPRRSLQQQLPALRPQPQHRRQPRLTERPCKGDNTVYHDPAHPSALVLPVVPRP